MFQDETQPENQLERARPLPSRPASQDPEVQRKRMLIALGILLVALAAVVLRDWDFWFPPSGEEQEATVRSKRNSEVRAPLQHLPRQSPQSGNRSQPSPRHPLRPKFPSLQAPSAQRCLLSRWKS